MHESAREIVESIRSRRRSAVEVTQYFLDQIRGHNDRLNAFLEVFDESALARAKMIDQSLANRSDAGALAGLPIAIKDNICTTVGHTTCAAGILENFRAPYAAHVIERLEAAGAIILGKTNLDEFAMGSSTENSSRGPSRNPWDQDRVPGGSSGGSAVAVAATLAPVALGSETGGSVRQPAALCGITGVKPSYGRVSRYGLVAFASSLDQIGPFGRTVEDAALVMRTIAGHDARDSTSADLAVPDYLAGLHRPLKGLRIGFAPEYFGEGLNAEVRGAVEGALDLLRREGADVREVSLPHMTYGVAVYYLVATAEASSNLARYDGVRYGVRNPEATEVFDLYARSRESGLGAEVKRRIMLGTYALSAGYYDAYYLKALKVRTLIKQDFDRAFEQVDVILSPTSPTTAFKLGEKTADPLAMYLADVYTLSANLAGICAISVPCGFDSQNLPIGLQLMAPAFAENMLFAAAHQYQLRTDFHTRAPSLIPA